MERSVPLYLPSSSVLVHFCVPFENVKIVNESVNLWGVCWKNYISSSHFVRVSSYFFVSHYIFNFQKY